MIAVQLFRLLRPLLAVAVGLFLGVLATKFAGENPLNVLEILVKGAFGSTYAIGMTLFYATPLLLTGISVSIAFQSGLFNIGAEGQLTLGALAAAGVGILFPQLPWPLAPVVAGAAAFFAGAAWGALPGWLRARRGSHEVINTIMLNFIASGIAGWVTLYLWKNPDSQNPETRAVGTGYLIDKLSFFGDAPVSTALFMAVAVWALSFFFLRRTPWGFEIRATGQNESAAQASGIDTGRTRILAMALAGGVAGLVGVGEVLGNSTRFKFDFSPGFGFTGIAVALLGRNHPLGVLASALLFGALHKGAADLDLETEHVTHDLSMILQALVILSVSAEGLWAWLDRKRARE